MPIIISAVFIFIYLIMLFFLKGSLIFFGVDYIFVFLSIIMSYASDQQFLIPYYDFTIQELKFLKYGSYIQTLFFIIFTVLGLVLKIAPSDIDEKELKTKRILSWFLFGISLIPLFAALNNYSEVQRQEKLSSHYKEVIFTDNSEYTTMNDILMLKVDVGDYEKENRRFIMSKGDTVLKIQELNIAKESDFISILKNRYSYNLKLKQSKETIFKKNKALVVEYYLNNDYNRDYIVRVDQRFFVLSLRTTQLEKEFAIKEFKEFLTYSVYLYKE